MSRTSCRRRSVGTACSRRGPHAVRIQPAAAAAAVVANFRRVSVSGWSSTAIAPSVVRARSHGSQRRALRRQRLESRLVRAVTMHAQQILLRAVPLADPPAEGAGTPVAELLAVALPAHAVRLLEWHRLAAGEV